MRSNRDQQTIDEKIHHFMARKSPVRTLSRTIAERFTPTRLRKRRTGMTYEQTRWGGNRIAPTY